MSRSLIGVVLGRDSSTSFAMACLMLIMPVGEMEGRVIQITLNHIMLTLKLKALIKVQTLTQTHNYRQVWLSKVPQFTSKNFKKRWLPSYLPALFSTPSDFNLFVSAIVCTVPPHSIYKKHTGFVLITLTQTILTPYWKKKKSSSNTKSISNHLQTNKHNS